MARAISITASFWAWDPGRTGATATAGANIASSEVAAEGTSPAVETGAVMQATVEVATQKQRVVAGPAVHPAVHPVVPLRTQQQPAVVAGLMVLPMPQQRTVEVEARTAVANTVNQ